IASAMWQELEAIAARLNDDAAIKVVVITGAGDAAFSAGADILEMQQALSDPPRMKVMQQAVLDAQVAWERLPMPTLAVIRGACTGGGCGLALACDLRLATPDAFFAIPPAKLGLAYSLADTKRLHDLVGPSRAKEILYTGRRILAEEALSLGLINEIVAAEALEERAVSLAREIAHNAGNSVRAAKAVVNMITAGVLAETPESRRYYDESFSSPEFLEGARAFMEKRRPRF
ncbi:MAG: enoyl-CoA hydratase/isomerase family protein, partial [Gammaproteobacteria bacterium]